MSELQEALESLERDGYGTVSSYSGRGMFGKKCIGFTTDLVGVKLGVMIAQTLYNLHGEDGLLDTIADECKSDSMGLQTIYYWPRIEYFETEEIEVEDE